MKFVKQELDFLYEYATCVDTQQPLSDKVFIIFSKDQIEFIQESTSVSLYKKIEKECDKEFISGFETIQLAKFIQSCKDTDTLEFTENNIIINDTSKYELNRFDGIVDKDKYISILNREDSWNRFTVFDCNLLARLKSFVSATEEELKGYGLVSNYFLATDRYNLTCAIKSSNEIEDINFQYILKNFVKDGTLELSIDEEYDGYIVNNENYIAFISNQQLQLPNIFNDEIQLAFNHSTFINVNKDDILSVLERMMVVSNSNLFHRIYITCQESSIVIECKDDYESSEIVNTIDPVDEDLVGKTFVMSAKYLKEICDFLPEDNIQIHLPSDEEYAVAVLVKNKDNDNILFIHNLYINIRSE